MEKAVKPCVIGLGKLGLPLAAVIADAGFDTVGIDSNTTHVKNLNVGGFDSPEPELKSLLENNSSRLNFSSDYLSGKDCDIYFIIVPTPSSSDGSFDHSYLKLSISNLLDSWTAEFGAKTIVIVSTVMPGTCSNELQPMISEWILRQKNSLEINILYSPEFIALGSVVYNLRNPDMTLIGADSDEHIYDFLTVIRKITVNDHQIQLLNLTEAEIVKILVNCFVTMKISFANFIGEIANAVKDVDPRKISSALGMDTRIGGKYLRPGLGFAGPCFPRDNAALIQFSKYKGLNASLAVATNEVNLRQPSNTVKRLLTECPNAKLVGIVGIAYKPETKVFEESQTLKIATILRELDIEVYLYDPLLTNADLNSSAFSVKNSLIDLRACDIVMVSKDFSTVEVEDLKNYTNTLVV